MLNPKTMRSQSTRENGSAFIITLLALVVLSILLLSLSVITQTERQIATNDLSTQRAFYAADSGVNLALARVLTVNSSVESTQITSTTPISFTLGEPAVGNLKRAQRVTLSPFVPIETQTCDGCSERIGHDNLGDINHAVNAVSRRLTWTSADLLPPDTAIPAATKRVYTQIGLYPWWSPNWLAIADPELVRQISQDTAGVYTPP